MKLTIICVGNKLEPHQDAWISTYLLRIKKYCPISLLKLKDGKDVWTTIQKAVPQKSQLILLDERGKLQTTPQLSNWFENTLRKNPSLTFVIGGSFGFDDAQRASADHLIALSPMTLPHRLALLTLTEQLYRILTIKAGHPYHHSE